MDAITGLYVGLIVSLLIVIIIMAILWGLGFGICPSTEYPNTFEIFTFRSYPSLSSSSPPSIRDSRYCEFLIVQGTEPSLTATVYTTYGLNDCPQSCLSTLTPQDLVADAQKLGLPQVQEALINAPRFWTMDAISSANSPPPPVSLGCMEVHEVAKVPMTTTSPVSPYTEQVIDRNTHYTYYKDRYIYLLESPTKETYILQSYTTMVNPSLTLRLLPTLLNNGLSLPSGWTYRPVLLSFDLSVDTLNGKAYVIQDNLKNTYQRLSTSSLNFLI